jgi:hypothetical protein
LTEAAPVSTVGYYAHGAHAWWGSAPAFRVEREEWGRVDWHDITAVSLRREIEPGLIVRVLRPGIITLTLADGKDLAALFLDKGDDVFDDILDVRAAQMRYLNALSICIHSGIFGEQQVDVAPTLVSSENLLGATMDDEGHLVRIGGQRASQIDQIIRDGTRRGLIDIGGLERGIDLFESAVQSAFSETVSLVALLNEAVCAYRQHNFPLAVVASWSICERLQSVTWERYYESAAAQGNVNLNKDRRKSLKGRDYSASVVATILQLAGVLKPDIWAQLNAGRSARNRWLHGGERPDRLTSARCIEAAITMLDRTVGFTTSVGGYLSTDL